jgi:hypothetical protein
MSRVLVRDIGKFLPAAYAAQRERMQAKLLAERQALWRAALNRACLDPRIREQLERKLYRDEGITLEDWPGLAPLTGAERTELIKHVRQIFGLEVMQPCRCPQAKDNVHKPECWAEQRKQADARRRKS